MPEKLAIPTATENHYPLEKLLLPKTIKFTGVTFRKNQKWYPKLVIMFLSNILQKNKWPQSAYRPLSLYTGCITLMV